MVKANGTKPGAADFQDGQLFLNQLWICEGTRQAGHPWNGANYGPFLVFKGSRSGGADGE